MSRVALWLLAGTFLLAAVPLVAAPVCHVWTESSLVKVFPEARPRRLRPVRIEACRNEWESFQVVVRAGRQAMADVSLVPSRLLGASGELGTECVEVFREHFVKVEQPSGNSVAEPREWPDALIPLRAAGMCKALPGRNLVFWVTVKVPESAAPGEYRGSVALSQGAEVVRTVPVRLRVQDISLPTRNHQGATAALYYDLLLAHYNKHLREDRPPLAEGVPEWEALKERYYRFLLEYRITPYDLPVPMASTEGLRLLSDPRVSRFRVPWVGEDTRPLREVVALLEGIGALNRAFYYQVDEPPLGRYGEVRRIAERLRQAAPAIPQLVTLFPTPDLYGSVGIWCPDLGDTFGLGYLDHRLLAERRAAGEETWWYTMCVPRAPYPTWLVDDDATAHRIFFWMQALYRMTGFVYSMVHGWSDDPYRSVASTAGSNGDGLLVYPGDPFGASEPFPSIRLQVLRDGLEDYECLWLLRERTVDVLRTLGIPEAQVEARAQEVVASHCRRLIASERAFARHPQHMERARHELIEEVLRAQDSPLLAAALLRQAPRSAASGPALWVVAEAGARVEVSGRQVAARAPARSLLWTPVDHFPVVVRATLGGRTRAVTRWAPWPGEAPSRRPRVNCPKLKRPPVVDGLVTPEEWGSAARLRPALLANGLGRARARTECFVGHTDGALHFGVRCSLSNNAQDRAEQSVGLTLDPPPLGDARIELLLTGEGGRYAQLRSRRGHSSVRIPLRWAHRVADGVWECEATVEFGPLLPAPKPGTWWAFNVERQAGPEMGTWALTYGDIRRLGRLLFPRSGE